MAEIEELFATRIYRADGAGSTKLNRALERLALSLAMDDRAGQRWCETHGYPGYTSYSSLDDLCGHYAEFARLETILKRHALAFARLQHWDLRGNLPLVDSLWVNVLPEGGSHTSHIHTNAVISGTYYVCVPEGAGPIVYEDPRLGLMMAAPPRKATAPRAFQSHVPVRPKPGTLVLWESWLRHEVPLNRADGNRITVSFNFCLGQPD